MRECEHGKFRYRIRRFGSTEVLITLKASDGFKACHAAARLLSLPPGVAVDLWWELVPRRGRAPAAEERAGSAAPTREDGR
jgi:hypothetical protein